MNDIEEIDPRVQRRAARAMKRATQFYLRMAIRFASVRPCWYIRPSPVKPDVATAIDDGYEADTDGPGSNGLTKSGIKGPKDKASQTETRARRRYARCRIRHLKNATRYGSSSGSSSSTE